MRDGQQMQGNQQLTPGMQGHNNPQYMGQQQMPGVAAQGNMNNGMYAPGMPPQNNPKGNNLLAAFQNQMKGGAPGQQKQQVNPHLKKTNFDNYYERKLHEEREGQQ